ncbi:MAG: hypothetical protein KF678_08280 [Phycisphaeraceae bacterium]|nr:hypothetical protein [Phycisphaeraceae bacterium]
MPKLLLLILLFSTPLHAQQTQNLFLIIPDGLRWQEVFRGMDSSMLTKENKAEPAAPLREAFWFEDLEARRRALMPFLWTTVATEGQIYGNRDKNAPSRVTNPYHVSYPGYSEVICGFAEFSITNNTKIPNPNVSVFEFLHAKPNFAGKVAAFGTWDTYPYIFNSLRSGILVDDGIAPLTRGTLTPTIEAINTLRKETPRRWSSAHFDSLSYRAAREWIAANTPRLCFIGLGETDEWAHEGDYANYLKAAHRSDAYIRELWDFCQSHPTYKGTTTFIITTDHGRGDHDGGPTAWFNHNAQTPGCEAIWIAILGPDTPALGERRDTSEVTQAQIAATIAALLGEDYNAAEPRAAKPIAEALPSR